MFELVYKHPLMDQVMFKSNIIYNSTQDKPLKLDIFYPLESTSQQSKTVILAHGSSSMENIKDMAVFQSWGKVMAASGFTTIVFNWRPDDFPMDMSALISFVRANHEELEIYKDNISIFGFSAGVENAIKESIKGNSDYIKSIVAYYGKIDPSSFELLEKNHCPAVFIAMGALDDNYSTDCNNEFVNNAKKLGASVEMIIHSKGEHGFDVFNDDEETKVIIDRTIDFIMKY